ncbi:MAG: LysM peptidoglycan-binding domain-containing protein [Calditrichaeota bacterium]|nr:LysM peptidoglycan-binding domain-containing protein [Calditrichota bacterium]
MAALTGLIASIWKGVIGLIRLSFFLLVILVFAFASGWLEIRCNPVKMRKDVEQRIHEFKEALSTQNQAHQNYESIPLFRQEGNYDLLAHKVRAGERLVDLEKVYGTDWRVIQKVNKISNPRRLVAGQIVLIPVKKGFG